MVDVYFNELSIDSSFINLPSSKTEAKELLLGFIKTSLSYILAVGIDKNPVMLIHNSLPLFTSIQLYNTGFIKDLLLELYQENRISEIEKQKFQLFVNDSFSKEWEGEYRYNGQEVFGIGKAKEEDTYVISFSTNIIGSSYDWSHSQYLIEKTSQSGTITFDFERNIASPKHTFQKYKIWKKCRFKITTPAKNLLPNSTYSNVVAMAYDFDDWNAFYGNIQKISKTTIKEVSKIVATINGWNETQECPMQMRLLFEGKNYYLATDTQHGTFEVYQGKDSHKGEIFFNDSTINTRKQDRNRGICGKKGKK